jgi:tRNA (guanine-N7-)-methyltransferase
LKANGEIHFKTDNEDLFVDSIAYFESSGYEITSRIDDLHAANFPDNFQTEHEIMFSEQGIPIKFLIARLG